MSDYKIIINKEEIRADDEFCDVDGVTWVKVEDRFDSKMLIGQTYRYGLHMPLRRKIN